MKKRYILTLCLPLVFLGLTAGCAEDAEPEAVAPEDAPPGSATAEPSPLLPSLTPGAIQATITMENGDTITLELYPDVAPQSVYNFVYLARQGFYDGLNFHRIISGFMIQGGGPDGAGRGEPPHRIRGEFSNNGFENNLSHVRGVLSMARPGPAYDGAGAQFFIVHQDSPHLNGSYASFGMVIDGMDTVDNIAATPVTDANGSVAPENRPVIRSITIDSETELPEPEKL